MKSPAPDDRVGAIAPPPAIFAAAFVLGLLLERVAPFDPAADAGARVALGFAPLAVGIALGLWALATFRAVGTTFNPLGGTTTLATRGPYAHTRNPMYVATALAYMGLAAMLGSIWALLLLPVAVATVHFGVVLPEERYLARKMGGAYLDYCRRVRRWI